MLRKLLTIYKDAILYQNRPEHPSDQLYIFFDQEENEWISIPKKEISDKELNLLNALYELIEVPVKPVTSLAKSWFDFLLLDGLPPQYTNDTYFRFIQFHITGEGANQLEIEAALKGFFTEDVLIIWENGNKGFVIEEKKQISLSEEELISMSETLESDFYVKISFFIGKLNPFSEQLNTFFQQERDYFTFSLTHLTHPNIFTFERVFPPYIAFFLPEGIKQKLNQELSEIFHDDPDMFSTIKIFLENNLNASLTAKKLYIHRNTLQYRLDKFTEKTGIGLKDFYGAFTVYLACLLFEHNLN